MLIHAGPQANNMLKEMTLSRSFQAKHAKKKNWFLKALIMQVDRAININPHLYLALVPSALEARYRGIYIISMIMAMVC